MATVNNQNGQEYRILLVGKTGVGKSSTGNSILGARKFKTSLGLKSETVVTQYGETEIYGRKLVVVDTPGFYDTAKSNECTSRELVKIFGLLSPGFHALVYVMSPERFTRECLKTKNLFFKVFGPGVIRYTMIIVTGKDRLIAENVTLEKFVSDGNDHFKTFLNTCGGRIVSINNKADGPELETDVAKVLEMVETIQNSVGHKCFTNLQFQTMKLYNRIGRMGGRVNIKKARQILFKRISQRYGGEEQSAFGPTSPSTKKLKLKMKQLHENEIDLNIEESDDSSNEDEDKMSKEREIMLQNKSFFDKLLGFFANLFESLFSSDS